jgi:hypothetical protein
MRPKKSERNRASEIFPCSTVSRSKPDHFTREAHQVSAHAHPEAVTPDRLPVDGELFRDEFVDHGKVLSVEAFFYPPTNEGLVLVADRFRPVDGLALTPSNDC